MVLAESSNGQEDLAGHKDAVVTVREGVSNGEGFKLHGFLMASMKRVRHLARPGDVRNA